MDDEKICKMSVITGECDHNSNFGIMIHREHHNYLSGAERDSGQVRVKKSHQSSGITEIKACQEVATSVWLQKITHKKIFKNYHLAPESGSKILKRRWTEGCTLLQFYSLCIGYQLNLKMNLILVYTALNGLPPYVFKNCYSLSTIIGPELP